MTPMGSDTERSLITLVQRTREEKGRGEVLRGDRYETQQHMEIVCIHTQQYIPNIRFVKLSKVKKVKNTSFKTLIMSERNFEDNIETLKKNKKTFRILNKRGYSLYITLTKFATYSQYIKTF